MMKRLLTAMVTVSLVLGCGGTASDDTTMPADETPAQGGNDTTQPGTNPDPGATPTEATTLSLLVNTKGDDDAFGVLAGARIYIEPFSSPDAAEVIPHKTFPGMPHGVTDENGLVTIEIDPDQKYVFHVLAEGHGTIMRTFEPADRDQLFHVVTLLPVFTTMVTLPAEGEEPAEVILGSTMGGTENLVTIKLDAGDLAFKTATTSSALRLKQADESDSEADVSEEELVEGEIEIVYQAWDPFVDDPSSMPADLVTQGDNGEQPIASYGMFSIEFFQNGESINVADGRTVEWDITVNEAFAKSAENAFSQGSLNVYSVDGGSGLWIEDDVPKSYDAENRIFSSESTHFSHKNCDDPGPYNCNGCVDVTAKDECGNTINGSNNVNVSVSGSSSGNRTGCHNLPSALRNPRRAETLTGNVTVSALRKAGNVARESVTYSTTCDDDGSTGCGTNSCQNIEVELDVMSDLGESCTVRDDCGCASDGIGQGLACIEGTCAACLGKDEASRVNDPCSSDDHCCRGAANDLGVDLVCEDFRCVQP